jgi:hypothetical protein
MVSKQAGSMATKGTDYDSIPHPQPVQYANLVEEDRLDRSGKVLDLSRTATVARSVLVIVRCAIPPVFFFRHLEEWMVHGLR